MKISYRTAYRLDNKIILLHVKYKIYKTKDPLFSCTTSSSWGILLVTLGFLKKIIISKIDRWEFKKLNKKIPHDHDSLGKSDILIVTKEKSNGRMNASAEKYTYSFLRNIIKLKQYRFSFRHDEWATIIDCVCIMKCTSSWWLFSWLRAESVLLNTSNNGT